MRPYLELVRLPAVFTAPSDVLLGMALALSAGATLDMLEGFLLVFASVCIYAAGMVCNDIFDVDVDTLERPSRPIPSGRVSAQAAWTFALVLQTLGLVTALVVSERALVAVGIVIFLTYLYNGWAKTFWLGPICMGACRYGNALIGLSVMTAPNVEAVCVPILIWVYVIGLTSVSRFEVRGLEGNFGKTVVGMFCLCALGGLVLPLGFKDAMRLELWVMGLVPFFWLAPTAYRVLHGKGQGAGVRTLVMRGIEGIAVYNGALAITFGSLNLGILALMLIIPGRWVGRWFYST